MVTMLCRKVLLVLLFQEPQFPGQRYIMRIIFFIKTAVSSNGSLDPGPQGLAGLPHGVPVEGPHHILYLLDQILGLVARLCNNP